MKDIKFKDGEFDRTPSQIAALYDEDLIGLTDEEKEIAALAELGGAEGGEIPSKTARNNHEGKVLPDGKKRTPIIRTMIKKEEKEVTSAPAMGTAR